MLARNFPESPDFTFQAGEPEGEHVVALLMHTSRVCASWTGCDTEPALQDSFLCLKEDFLLPFPSLVRTWELEEGAWGITPVPICVTESERKKHVFRALAKSGKRRNESKMNLSWCSTVGCCALWGHQGGRRLRWCISVLDGAYYLTSRFFP